MNEIELIPNKNGLYIVFNELKCKDKNTIVGGHEHTDKCYKQDKYFISAIECCELKRLLKKADCRYRQNYSFSATNSFISWDSDLFKQKKENQ